MSPFLEGNLEPEWFRSRLNLVLIWISIAFSILAGRLFWLQVIKGEEFRKLSLNNRVRLKRIHPARGLIYDRNDRLIVDNRPAFNLKVVPKDTESIDELVKSLRNYVEIDEKAVKELKEASVYTPFKPVTVASDIKREIVAIIEANQYFLSGASISVEPKREYLYPGIAAHTIGYLGEVNSKFLKSNPKSPLKIGDYRGKSGLEKQYEDELRGRFGGAQVEVNARGQVMQILNEVPSVPGKNLILTIDLELQKYGMELLGEEAGSVVAMDPYTGEILCMVSAPSFNENLFVTGMSNKQWKSLLDNPKRPLTNKSIQEKYPPGSIYKVIPAMAGLEEGLIDSDDKFMCTGKHFFGDRYFRCWNEYGHGNINVVDAMIHSCDVYFYKLGNKLGIDKLAEYARRFGLGRKTGIEIDNEVAGIVPDSAWKRKRFNRSWKGGETLSVVIGQGYNEVTPLQMACMTSAIANGGYLVKPRLVNAITDSRGEKTKEIIFKEPENLNFKKRNLEIIKKSLDGVVNQPVGTAFGIKSDIVRISGKTGTAQVVSSEKHKESKKKRKKWLPHAWFIAYAPSEKPEIAVAVLVENGEHGSTAAAPIAQKIIEKFWQDKKK